MPRRGRVRTKPSCSSSVIASRIGVRLTPSPSDKPPLVEPDLLRMVVDIHRADRPLQRDIRLLRESWCRCPAAARRGSVPAGAAFWHADGIWYTSETATRFRDGQGRPYGPRSVHCRSGTGAATGGAANTRAIPSRALELRTLRRPLGDDDAKAGLRRSLLPLGPDQAEPLRRRRLPDPVGQGGDPVEHARLPQRAGRGRRPAPGARARHRDSPPYLRRDQSAGAARPHHPRDPPARAAAR